MDMSQYKSLFLTEAREYLKTIGEMVAALEQDATDRPAIDALFRGAHSLKGMAASMEYRDIVEVAHSMEDLMIRVREKTLAFDAGVADLVLEGTDVIDGLLAEVDADVAERRPIGDIASRLRGYFPKAPVTAPAGKAETSHARQPETPPVPVVEQAKPEQPKPEPAGEVATVRVKTELLDHLINLTGELISNKHRLLNIGKELRSPQLDDAVSETSKLLRALHDEVMKVRLMPFEVICDRFQRSIRSLAKRSGKDVNFVLEGREIGLDRGILEQLADPLNHLLRNAIDHGLETPAEREAAGKPSKGILKLAVSRDRDRVLVTVSDDGRGMRPEVMIESALRKGVITEEEADRLSPRQALMLCCIPGFSTAKEVTDISGRGVGMDAVSTSIQKMGGTLSIESEPGEGSVFTLKLPLSIAIINALVIECGPIKAGVPVSAVQRTVELRRNQVETIGRRQVFYMDEDAVPLLSLNRILGVPLGRFRDGLLPVFVTEAKGRRVGIVVDRLHGQHELFVKPLGRPLSKMTGMAGGATLGDGEIVTILDLADLL